MQFFLKNREVKDNSKFNEAEGLKETNSEKQIFLLLGKQNKSLYCTEIARIRGEIAKLLIWLNYFSETYRI